MNTVQIFHFLHYFYYTCMYVFGQRLSIWTLGEIKMSLYLILTQIFSYTVLLTSKPITDTIVWYSSHMRVTLSFASLLMNVRMTLNEPIRE